MTRDEWTQRYAAQFMKGLQCDEEFANEAAEVAAQAEEDTTYGGNFLVDGEWHDPEGAADDELACWENDE